VDRVPTCITQASRGRALLVRSLGLSKEAFWDEDLESGHEVEEPDDEHLKFIIQLCSLACVLSLGGIALVSVIAEIARLVGWRL
jgi:hypothetical protein